MASNPIQTVGSILVAFSLLCCLPTAAFEMPAANPFLADSNYAMAHADPAQQDALPQAGPAGPSRQLSQDEIQYVHTGPGFFGISTSGEYPGGKRVFWGNGIDRIVKLDYDSHEIVAEYFFPGAQVFTAEQADKSIASFDKRNEGVSALYNAFGEAKKLTNLSNLYTVLDKDHTYYVGNKSGLLTAYGDADPQDHRSPIVKLREFQLPPEATGPIMGLSMTYDGWLIVATEHGYIAAMSRDFKQHYLTRLKHSEGAEGKATQSTGYGWIRNAYALDAAGGIYIASQQHMHKVVWTGNGLSTDEADGAWTAEYLNDWGHGTGATPSLMGFGSEDQFVVITDGQLQMNVVLFWRNGIPKDWKQLADAPDRRIAGQAAVTMGDDSLTDIQSEQSVVVAGYGAMVVNNHPRNIPWYLPGRAASLLISYLGSNQRHQPYGVQKFAWATESRTLSESWVNTEISSPSTVPIVGVGSNTAYLIGARENQWTLEALDWDTGESRFHYVIGGQRYNVMFAGTLIDMDGRIHYGTPWGRVRLNTD
ncbi:MAG: hypothetical protein ACI9JM_000603 [Halioglobus sp.]|jgi:hypothetical protein